MSTKGSPIIIEISSSHEPTHQHERISDQEDFFSDTKYEEDGDEDEDNHPKVNN
jgi:hypothetical protein